MSADSAHEMKAPPLSPSKDKIFVSGWASDDVFGPVYVLKKTIDNDYIVVYADECKKEARHDIDNAITEMISAFEGSMP